MIRYSYDRREASNRGYIFNKAHNLSFEDAADGLKEIGKAAKKYDTLCQVAVPIFQKVA